MKSLHGLKRLQQQLDEQLRLLNLPEPAWMPQREFKQQRLHDVVIIGAGMAGLCAGAALKLKGIHDIALYDAAPAGQEGPWATFARMSTLRSPKELAGPALGIPALTFQAWYIAQYGPTAWQALDRIPRLLWHDYLQWYRHALQLPVHHEHTLQGLHLLHCETLDIPVIACRLQTANGHQTVYARHLVLATGMDSLGGPNIPEWAKALPRHRWHHSSEVIDLSQFRGQDLVIVGGGDSALDTAAAALDAGVHHVDLCIRAADFSQINYWKAYTHAGHRHGFQQLSTAQKSALFGFLGQQITPPARGTINRISRLKGLQLHFGCAIQTAQSTPQQPLCLTTSGPDKLQADHLILATGYVTAPGLRPELEELLPHMDFYPAHFFAPNMPPAAQTVPRLREDFSLQAHNPEQQPALSVIHCFSHASLLSVGKIAGDIPGISVGAQKISEGIVAKLYEKEFAHQLEQLHDYDEQEVTQEDLDQLRPLQAAAHALSD